METQQLSVTDVLRCYKCQEAQSCSIAHWIQTAPVTEQRRSTEKLHSTYKMIVQRYI